MSSCWFVRSFVTDGRIWICRCRRRRCLAVLLSNCSGRFERENRNGLQLNGKEKKERKKERKKRKEGICRSLDGQGCMTTRINGIKRSSNTSLIPLYFMSAAFVHPSRSLAVHSGGRKYKFNWPQREQASGLFRNLIAVLCGGAARRGSATTRKAVRDQPTHSLPQQRTPVPFYLCPR